MQLGDLSRAYILAHKPATYAERGVSVPFTTPLLAQSRVRLDQDGRLECLLPGFSGGKGVYVIPWVGLPEIVPITLHDRALYKEIVAAKAKTPSAMRTAALDVAKRGYAGPQAAERARIVLDRDQEQAVLTQYLMMVSLLRESKVSTAELLGDGLRTEESKRRAKAAIVALAGRLNTSGDLLFGRLETLVSQLAAVGLPGSPAPGRLRHLLEDIERFRTDLVGWAAGEDAELNDLAGFVGSCARHTLGIAQAMIGTMDRAMSSVRGLIANEFKGANELVAKAERLSWLLDGWDYPVRLWEAAGDEMDARREALCEIFRTLPALPQEEAKAGMVDGDMDGMNKIQRRWVRANQDWRTGSVDYGAVRQLEGVKALAQ